MLIRPKRDIIASLAVITLVIGIIASWPVTNIEVRQFSLIVRLITFVVCAVCLLLLLLCVKFKKTALISIIILYLLFGYGTFLSVVHGGWHSAILNIPETVFLSTVGILIFSFKAEPVQYREAISILLFAIVILLFNIISGGLIIDIPPRYIFSYQENLIGSTVLYGQGVTKFFAIAAIMSSYLLSLENTWTKKVILFCGVLVFSILSLLGGARGDSIALFLTILIIYIPRAPIKILVASLGVYLFAFLFFSHFPYRDELVILNRMQSVLDGSAGIREALYRQALVILLDNPKCFFFGCGFDYFQTVLGLERSMYPHNFVLESALVWGVPITAVLVAFFVIGLLVDLLGKKQFNGLLVITIYLTIVFSKSGSIASGGLFLICFLLYLSRGVGILLSFQRKENKISTLALKTP